ncbi:MAG: hypothetical protein U5R06_03025 [candidate division KSB1 bacterium]|nr:hypothetical protein [candidate division KSB1 bacterium]
MANYEAMRAMFEAFHVNRSNATGIIQWMLNSAMPGMLWQLYDWYLMPNGAFYGAKNGCRPLNLVYHYKDHSIYLINDYLQAVEDLSAEIRMLAMDGRELFAKTIEIRIGANQSYRLYSLPVVQCCENIYFLDLRLKTPADKTPLINFYWLSTKQDVLDYESGEWFLTAHSSFADFTAINRMEKADIVTKHTFIEQDEKG